MKRLIMAALAVTALVAGAGCHQVLNKQSGEVYGVIFVASADVVSGAITGRFPGKAECQAFNAQVLAKRIEQVGPPPADIKVLGACVSESEATDLLAK